MWNSPFQPPSHDPGTHLRSQTPKVCNHGHDWSFAVSTSNFGRHTRCCLRSCVTHWLISTGLFSVLAESAVPGSNPQYKILNIDMPTSDVDIMGSVIPQLTSPFALKAYPVLAICALVQQQRSLKN